MLVVTNYEHVFLIIKFTSILIFIHVIIKTSV